MSENRNNSREQGMEKYFFRASAAEFRKIPGSPVAYWLSDAIIKSFERGDLFSSHCATRKGMATGLNAFFVRGWHEVGSMPFCVELDNLKDTDAPIHQPAAMLVAAD